MALRTVFIDSSLSYYNEIAAQYDPAAFTVVRIDDPAHGYAQIQAALDAGATSINVVSASSSVPGLFTSRVVFIDPGVAGCAQLVAAVPADATIVLLDATRDGLLQIRDFLAANTGVVGAIDIVTGLASVDLVSHGATGTVILGSAVLSNDTVAGYAAVLKEIGSHLSDSADILIYGCDVAAGSDGVALIEALATATGADVAASTDPTGAASLGGDWVLEASTGVIEAQVIGDTAYAGLLNVTAATLTTTLSTTDATPTIGGNYTSNNGAAKLYVWLDGTNVATVELSASQTNAPWSYTFPNNLATGNHTLVITANPGNIVQEVLVSTRTLTILAPDVPAPTGLDLAAADDTGSSSVDNLTNKTSGLTITGNGVNGNTVTLFDDANNNGVRDSNEGSLGTASVSGGSFTVDIALAEGVHHVRAIQADGANNLSSPSGSLSITIDTTAPGALQSLGELDLAAGDDSGTSNSDNNTSQTSGLTVSGTGESGASVALFDDADDDGVIDGGELLTTTTVVDGSFSVDIALAEGLHHIRAKQTDPAGNQSVATTALNLTVDTSAPAAGTLSFTGLTDTGSDDTVDITQDNAFNLSLAGQESAANVVYQVSFNNGDWASTTAAQSALADGNYRFRAVVTDAAGNDATSNVLEVVIDNTDPAPGTLSFAGLDDTGSDDPVDITQDNSFNLSLAGQESAANVVYQVSFNNGDWASTTAAQSALADGNYRFRAVVTDAAGNDATSNVLEVVIDNTDPAPGVLSFTDLTDTGSDDTVDITQDNSFNLSLAGQESAANVVYQVSFNNGDWTSTTAAQSALADGNYRFRAVVTDAAGNDDTSNVLEVVIDKTAPAPGTLSFTDLTDTGSNDPIDITQDNAFSLALAGQESTASSAYQVSFNNGDWTSTTAAQSALADGNYRYRALVTDAAGNAATSNVLEVVIDKTAPAPGALSFTGLDDTGSDDPVDVTQDNSFNLSLAGQESTANVVYQVSFNNGDWTSTTAAQSALADGNYRYRAVVTDAAGNAATSNVLEVVIDKTAPAPGTLSFTGLDDTGSDDPIDITQDNAFSLALAGQESTASSAYQVSFNNGDWTSTTAAQSALADGNYRYRAVVTDAAGNDATSNVLEVVIDNTDPVPGNLSFQSLTDTGSDDTVDITQDNAFNLALDGQESTASVAYQVSFNNGDWASTAAAQSALADGNYRFRAVVTDAAGNDATSNVLEVVIDNTDPVPGNLSFQSLTDTGSDDTVDITQDNAFNLALDGQESTASVAYQVSFNNGDWASTAAAQSALADGNYRFRAVVTDAAGNDATSNVLEVV
ncbi:Ig-like domain-containing protein, partial [Ramlibacter sp. MAHUQ-53]|uniref:Ig-like domain-containing protein n=1 Tax=unclassified Ramlibacter TaxID=2617605 RepID=UPI00363E5ED7